MVKVNGSGIVVDFVSNIFNTLTQPNNTTFPATTKTL